MSGELRSGQVISCQFRSGQCPGKAHHVWSCQDKVRSCQVRSCLARRGHDFVRVGHVMLGQMRSDEVRSCQVRSCLARRGHDFVRVGHVMLGQMRSDEVRSCQSRSIHVGPGQVKSRSVQLK